ncbi:MAG: hypothetical protein LBS50_04935 [Prevotellaceae bacterium]|nr:hypothetical protein [Prevotellaceae bacterium]
MTTTKIVIAGIEITFWTEHLSDEEFLNEIFLYHTEQNPVPYDRKECHDVIISSLTGKVITTDEKQLVWNGYINENMPVKWYNVNDTEDIVCIGNDIVIKHLPQRFITICHLSETKAKFFKSHRPRLTNYIFLLLHNIMSMHKKYCVHASCAAKNETAYLFLGKSGEGKTTLSSILGNAGWEYMGDDLVFISENENHEIIADGFLCKAKLLNAKMQTKDAIDIIKNQNFNYSYSKKIGTVVKLQKTAGNNSSLLPASQAESFAWLMSSGNNIRIQYHKQHWMNVAEKASDLPAYTLKFANKELFEPSILV